MSFLKNWRIHLFTIVLFLGVCFFNLTITKLLDVKEPKNLILYYVLEWIICSLLMYLITIPIMFVVERTEKKGILKPKSIIIVASATLILCVVLQVIMWPILDIAIWASNTRDVLKGFEIPYLYSYLFFLFMILNWLAFYYIYKVYLISKKSLEQKLEIEKKLKEANLNTLKGQINSHFIFNTLNNIRGLVQEDPLKSKEMITRLSELLRSSLLSGKTNTVPLEVEIETVENFLEISKIQYEERLNYSLQIDPKTLHLKVPPMILQMLVENSIKHGISTLKYGGNVLVQAFLDDENFNLNVTNTGNLNTNESGTKIGIKNIKERLHLLYNNNASFKLSEVGNEVVAHITIVKNSV